MLVPVIIGLIVIALIFAIDALQPKPQARFLLARMCSKISISYV